MFTGIKHRLRQVFGVRAREAEINEAAEIAFGGERVTHLHPNDLYYAHPSIYWFAVQFVRGMSVLDAGCGDGYGTHYLAEHGARSVVGIDISDVAITACRKNFQRGSLAYEVQDLASIHGFCDLSFEVVFSSNALEHMATPKGFFDHVHRLLHPSKGILVLAVPPVVDEVSRQANLIYPYHLNICTPRQWKSVLEIYFDQVRCYSHVFDKPGIELDFGNTPEQTKVRESDFKFAPVELNDLYSKPTITAIMVASSPKAVAPARLQGIPMVDESFTRSPASG
jgi:2-polyprenyl-3-methyl-5-hydroxy-6-metoxy-1,4-benzoquinol methylase